VAVMCALGVLAVTVALLFVLRPRDEGADTPPVSVPLPEDSVPTEPVPPEPVPTESVPTDTTVAPAPDSTGAPAP
jgi:hypothetical protein